MNTTDPLEHWKSLRMKVEIDERFAERVLRRIGCAPRKAGRWAWWNIPARSRVGAGVAAAIVLGVAVWFLQLLGATGIVLGLTIQGY